MGKPKNSTKFCTQVISNKKKKIEKNIEDLAKIIGVNEVTVECEKMGSKFICNFEFGDE
jgi:hypothetical protein